MRTCIHMHTPTPDDVVPLVFRLQTPAYTARKSHVTVMRQDLTNELLWEQQAKVVGTLLPSLSLLRSFTQPYLGTLHRPREGPVTCLPNEYKTKPLTDRWVTEVKCVHLLFLLFSFFFLRCCLLPPYFFPLHGIQLYISPSWHHSEKREWDERNKTEPKCGNFSSFLYSHMSGFIVNPVCVNQSAPGAKPHTSTLYEIWIIQSDNTETMY